MNDSRRRLRQNFYKQIARSEHGEGFGQRLLLWLGVPLATGLVRLAWRSARITRVLGSEHLDAALARQPSCIPVYWHQHHVFCIAWLLRRQRELPLRTGFLISPSRDGELGARVVRRLGGHPVRGSSTRTGALAMKELFQALIKEGVSPVINPDGPKGPRFKAKPGAILLAQMSGRELLPMAFHASRATLFHWDKFVLPWPFARVAIAVGEPYVVPRGGGEAGIAQAQAELERRLHETYRTARAALEP
jgi:lysophospholipid acyltransferase (LPLAT)-like uncharacterized protein